jgi:hypothetical protein
LVLFLHKQQHIHLLLQLICPSTLDELQQLLLLFWRNKYVYI